MREISDTMIRPHHQNTLCKASPVGYIQGKALQISIKDQMEWPHLPSCLVPSWWEASRITRDCWKPWGFSSPPGTTPPV